MTLSFTQLHPLFAAEVSAVDLRRFFDTADERLHNVAPLAARG